MLSRRLNIAHIRARKINDGSKIFAFAISTIAALGLFITKARDKRKVTFMQITRRLERKFDYASVIYNLIFVKTTQRRYIVDNKMCDDVLP